MNIKLRTEDGTELHISELSELEKHLTRSKALAVKINGHLSDLNSLQTIKADDIVEAVTFDARQGKDIYRHSTSHVMAHAVKRLFPGVRVAIGPSVENGFYYDFDIDRTFTPEDLVAIEQASIDILLKAGPLEQSLANDHNNQKGDDIFMKLHAKPYLCAESRAGRSGCPGPVSCARNFSLYAMPVLDAITGLYGRIAGIPSGPEQARGNAVESGERRG